MNMSEEKIKLFDMSPQLFIPKRIEGLEEVRGNLRVTFQESKRLCDIVLYDLFTVSSVKSLEGKIDFFNDYDIESFPQLKAEPGLYYRPLCYSKLSPFDMETLFLCYCEINKDIGNERIEGETIQSIFYKKIREIFCNVGYKYIMTKEEDGERSAFYIEEGAYFIDELRKEMRERFSLFYQWDSTLEPFVTVQFLDEKEPDNYVQPKFLSKTLEERMDIQKDKIIQWRGYL